MSVKWRKALAGAVLAVLAMASAAMLSGCTDLQEWLASQQKQVQKNGE